MYEVINLVPKNLIRKPLFVYQTKFAEGFKKNYIQNLTYLFRKSSYLVSKMEIGR